MAPRSFLLYFLLATFCTWSCSSMEPSSVNREIAGYYQEAFNPLQADEALRKARDADPRNAYTIYLQASRAADRGELRQAFALLEAGNSMPHTILYTFGPRPHGDMPLSSNLLSLYASLSKASSLGTRQPEYWAAVRTAGRRIVHASQGDFTVFSIGARLMVLPFKVEAAYWGEQEDPARESAAKAKFEEGIKWFRDSNYDFARTIPKLSKAAKDNNPPAERKRWYAAAAIAEWKSVERALAKMPNLK